MKRIDLTDTPSQSLSFDDNDTRYDLRIFAANGEMYADVDIDEIRVLSAVRVVADEPIIPYQYLAKQGNFAIICDKGCDPNWRKFGTEQFLYYATYKE